MNDGQPCFRAFACIRAHTQSTCARRRLFPEDHPPAKLSVGLGVRGCGGDDRESMTSRSRNGRNKQSYEMRIPPPDWRRGGCHCKCGPSRPTSISGPRPSGGVDAGPRVFRRNTRAPERTRNFPRTISNNRGLHQKYCDHRTGTSSPASADDRYRRSANYRKPLGVRRSVQPSLPPPTSEEEARRFILRAVSGRRPLPLRAAS